MCLYPKLIQNKKYTPNQKNGGIVPSFHDDRVLHVPIKCGNCIECRKAIARDWNIRLTEEIKTNTNAKFVTLTFSDESYTTISKLVTNEIEAQLELLKNQSIAHQKDKTEQKLLYKTNGYGLDNAIATYAVRHYLERQRKKTKKSLRHWLITELGHQGTENLHLHGLIWTDNLQELEKTWQYGFVWKGQDNNGKLQNYVNKQTINYITKYVTKVDLIHQYYKPIILCSHKPAIGHNYHKSPNAKLNQFKGTETNETYRTESGHKINLPIYYRNKLYTEEEREQLWINKLNQQTRYILGSKINIANGEEEYFKALEYAQQTNRELRYGDANKKWSRVAYERERRAMMQAARTNRTTKDNGNSD